MEREMDLLELIQMVLKRWWLVAISTVMLGILTFAYTMLFVAPTYVSKGMLYVSTLRATQAQMDYTDLTTAQQLVNTYIEILNSDTFMRKIALESGSPYSVSQLRSMVHMSGKNETELLDVRVTSADPVEASQLVAAILRFAPETLETIVASGTVKVVDGASVPSVPSGPNKRKNTLMGIVLGFVFGVVLTLVIGFFDNRVKNQYDLGSKHKLPLLGTIPKMDPEQ